MTASLSFKISEEEKKALEDYCKNNDIKMSQIIRKLVKDFLEQNKNI